MSQSLTDIAKELKDNSKKVQLIYAFNGSGKTRLSRAFKTLLASEIAGNDGEDIDQSELSSKNILYYNAFTEDLFYWDNDLDGDATRKLNIHPNAFTKWVLEEQGQDQNIITHFQRLTHSKVTPLFSPDFSSISFSLPNDDGDDLPNLKISKGEESNLIWSVFYSLLEQVIEELNSEASKRGTDAFDNLRYVFIDDPVSSLDDNHLIDLAIDLARLIKSSKFEKSGLKFIITTHNPLFYNVLHNEFKNAPKYALRRLDEGNHHLVEQNNDSPFSYHLQLKEELIKAANSGEIHKYHFNFLRNVLEKTSTFLGYKEWGELLPDVKGEQISGKGNPYARVINFYNHAKHSGHEIAEVEPDHKRVFKFLVKEIDNIYKGIRSQQGTQV